MATIEQVQGGLSQIPSGQENQPIDLVDQSTKEYQKEKLALLQIQQELLDSLQERSRPNAADFFLNLGAGFLAPNPTGSFGASLGNAATAVSGYRADQQKKVNDLAKMRMEMGVQQLGLKKEDIELAKEKQALKLIGDVFNADPQTVASDLAAGKVPGGNISKITPKLYAQISQVSPKLGVILKNAYDMDVEKLKLVNEDVKSGMQRAELIAKYGEGVVKYISNQVLATQPPQVPTNQPVAPSQTDELIPGLSGLKRNTDGTIVGDAKNEEDALRLSQILSAAGIPNAISAPTNKPSQDDTSNLPLATRNKIQEEAMLRSIEEFKPFRESIVAANPSVTAAQDRNLKELLSIIEANKSNVARGGADIFGLLQKQGVISALYKAAQDGVRTPIGSVGLEAENFLQNLTIPKELRPMLTRATQILSEQFLLNAKANKGVLGAQVSNWDAQMMQKPMANISDSSKSIEYWTRLNILGNKEREEIFKAYSNFPTQQKHQFVNSNEYKRILSDYNNFYNQFKQKYPITMQSSAEAEKQKKTDFTGKFGSFITNIIKP